MKSLYTVLYDLEHKKFGEDILPTGFKKMDAFLDGGFARKEVIILGGDTGIGKSFFAGQIALYMGLHEQRVGYFSLEISNHMVVARMVGQVANAKANLILRNELGVATSEAVVEAKSKILFGAKEMALYDDLYALEEIEREIEKMRLDFVVIDFVQNMIHQGLEYERLTEISKRLQKHAKKTDCCILILSQLSNTVADSKETDKKPRFKGSGQIGIIADQAFFLERNELDDTLVNLFLSKNRRGESKKVFELKLKIPGMKFTEL